MKSFIRKLKIVDIDVYVYHMSQYVSIEKPDFNFTIQKRNIKNKICYYIKDNDRVVHKSFLFDEIFLLKKIGKVGPAIGDCFTNKEYRGLSIYPFVLNHISKEILDEKKEVFVIVNRDNLSSIRGIEKAGFSILASIKAKRWLWFYLKSEINIKT